MLGKDTLCKQWPQETWVTVLMSDKIEAKTNTENGGLPNNEKVRAAGRQDNGKCICVLLQESWDDMRQKTDSRKEKVHQLK